MTEIPPATIVTPRVITDIGQKIRTMRFSNVANAGMRIQVVHKYAFKFPPNHPVVQSDGNTFTEKKGLKSTVAIQAQGITTEVPA